MNGSQKPMLQELGKQNPALLRLINENQAEFLRLINEARGFLPRSLQYASMTDWPIYLLFHFLVMSFCVWVIMSMLVSVE